MSKYYNPQAGGDHRILHAVDVVSQLNGTTLNLMSNRSLRKFGQNPDSDTGEYETVWTLGDNETYQTTNSIDTISSSNAADDQVISLAGFTISGSGLLTRVEQTVTLDGQNKVLLSTPLARVERGFNISATDTLGEVYVYRDTTLTDGVPTDLTMAHLQIEAQFQQSQKCALTTAQGEYLFVMSAGVATLAGLTASSDFSLETRLIDPPGLVFRNKLLISSANPGGASFIELNPVLIVAPNTDVRMRSKSSVNNQSVTAFISGYYMNISNYISPDA